MRQIPEVGHVPVHCDEVPHLGVGKAKVADGFLQRQAEGEGHCLPHLFAQIGENLPNEPPAVL